MNSIAGGGGDDDDDAAGTAGQVSCEQQPPRVGLLTLAMSPEMVLRDVQHLLEAQLTKVAPREYCAAAAEKCVVLVDDVQQARRDEFGTQESLELLRQWLDHRGWYMTGGLPGLARRARWVTRRARWVTLRTRWVTQRARWDKRRARWVMLTARWVTLRAR